MISGLPAKLIEVVKSLKLAQRLYLPMFINWSAASLAAFKYSVALAVFLALYFCHVPSNNMMRDMYANATALFTCKPATPSETRMFWLANCKSAITLSITSARGVRGLYKFSRSVFSMTVSNQGTSP